MHEYHKYLSMGPQTILTELVYRHAAKARNWIITDPEILRLPEPLIAAHKTCRYIHCTAALNKIKGYIPDEKTEDETRKNEELKKSVFRQRTLHQILEEGYFPTCSEYGLLFRGLMIAQGIPTAYVETFHEDFLLDKSFSTHTFARVFFEDKSVIIDPRKDGLRVYKEEKEIFPYIIVKEGLDCWDIGILCYADLHVFRKYHIKEILAKYEKIKASLQK